MEQPPTPVDRSSYSGSMALAPGSLLRLLFLCATALLLVHQLPRCARAGDPDILTDFVVPADIADPSKIDGSFFTHTRLVSGNAGDPAKFTVTKATAAEFPALLGQSVSFAMLVFGAGTVNPPHIHPRASELLVVVKGALFVGLVDAARNGTLHTAALQAGDMFVFPKGMVHFQSNNGTELALAFSAFGSASPGTVSLPTQLFETGIADAVLEKSFHTDQATVDALKHDLQQQPPAPAPERAPPQNSAGDVSLVGARLVAAMLCVGTAFSLLF